MTDNSGLASHESIFITAKCGHKREIKNSEHWEKSLAKAAQRDCPACIASRVAERTLAEQQAAADQKGITLAEQQALSRERKATVKIKKGHEPKHLPHGTRIELRFEDGAWSGVIVANGIMASTKSNGAMGIVSSLARKWLRESGAAVKGKVRE